MIRCHCFHYYDSTIHPAIGRLRLPNDRRFTARFKGTDDDRETYEGRAAAYRRSRQELLEIERRAAVDYLWGGEGAEQVIDVERRRVLRTHEQGWDRLGSVGGGEYVVNITADRLAARVAFAPVQKQATIGVASAVELSLPDHAILLDVDLVANRPGDSIDVNPHLNGAIRFLDDQLIPFVAQLLNGEDQ